LHGPRINAKGDQCKPEGKRQKHGNRHWVPAATVRIPTSTTTTGYHSIAKLDEDIFAKILHHITAGHGRVLCVYCLSKGCGMVMIDHIVSLYGGSVAIRCRRPRLISGGVRPRLAWSGALTGPVQPHRRYCRAGSVPFGAVQRRCERPSIPAPLNCQWRLVWLPRQQRMVS